MEVCALYCNSCFVREGVPPRVRCESMIAIAICWIPVPVFITLAGLRDALCWLAVERCRAGGAVAHHLGRASFSKLLFRQSTCGGPLQHHCVHIAGPAPSLQLNVPKDLLRDLSCHGVLFSFCGHHKPLQPLNLLGFHSSSGRHAANCFDFGRCR